MTFFGRAYFVRGYSPMSVTPASMQLEDVDTGEQLEITVDDLTGTGPSGHFFGAEDDGK